MQDLKDLERRTMLQEYAMIMSTVDGKPVSIETARTWTLAQWMHDLFPVSAGREISLGFRL